MNRSRATEEQIIGSLREQEAGASLADVRRKHGMSSATIHAWRSKCGCMVVSDVKRLKTLEAENAALMETLPKVAPGQTRAAARGAWRGLTPRLARASRDGFAFA